MQMSEEAKQAKREYERKWRAANKEKIKAIKSRYWEKKAAQMKGGEENANS